MPITLYFDESGFTGNRLLDPDQTIFSYGAVAIEPDEAADLARRLVSSYRVQSSELKGRALLKSNKGRRLLLELLATLRGRMKVSVSEKKYALGAKFFEYIFEPPLQKNNILFYRLDFHRFISNILYMEFIARGEGASEIFEQFEQYMRSADQQGLTTLFGAASHPGMSPILDRIKDFAFLNRQAIHEELAEYEGEGPMKWVLDLTNTALFSILAEWGQELDQMTVFCDQSKPLSHDQSMFNVMIGREDKQYSPLGNHPLTFNLSGPIAFVDSKEAPGVQLADCVASAFAHSLDRNREGEFEDSVREYIEGTVVYGSVFPDFDYIDLSKLSVVRNAVLLEELVNRSRRGADLLEGMQEYVQFVTAMLHIDPPRINA